MQINYDITPNSELLLRAARELVEEEGFDRQLDATVARISTTLVTACIFRIS